MAPVDPPKRCLAVDVSGPFAHFRKVGGNSTRQTYHAIPRTTAAGFFAAILGLERNSYYSDFGPNRSAMAIVPKTALRTVPLARSELSTAPESPSDLSDIGEAAGEEVGIVTVNKDSLASRQRNPYQMLRDVRYRIYLWLDNKDLYDELRDYLSKGQSVYTPTLGLSELLASVEFYGEIELTETDKSTIDSILPDDDARVKPTPDARYLRERVPQFMEQTADGGRRTTSFITYTMRSDGEPIDIAEEIPVATPTDDDLGDRLVFH